MACTPPQETPFFIFLFFKSKCSPRFHCQTHQNLHGMSVHPQKDYFELKKINQNPFMIIYTHTHTHLE